MNLVPTNPAYGLCPVCGSAQTGVIIDPVLLPARLCYHCGEQKYFQTVKEAVLGWKTAAFEQELIMDSFGGSYTEKYNRRKELIDKTVAVLLNKCKA